MTNAWRYILAVLLAALLVAAGGYWFAVRPLLANVGTVSSRADAERSRADNLDAALIASRKQLEDTLESLDRTEATSDRLTGQLNASLVEAGRLRDRLSGIRGLLGGVVGELGTSTDHGDILASGLDGDKELLGLAISAIRSCIERVGDIP